jgi:isoquinoline 1-oxidoreductase beta subunit
VIVEQADFYPERFERQFTGGSQSVRQGWKILRTAGAAGRHLLISAAAQTWNVPANEISTEAGTLHHKGTGKKISYGEVANKAAKLTIPEEVRLKDVKDFKIIRTSRKNVDGTKIVTGKPLFTIDYKQEGMLIAMIAHPPAFGLTVKSVDDSEARKMPGIREIFRIKTLPENYERNGFDTTSFTELVVVVGNSTWEVMNARKALKLEWEQAPATSFVVNGWGGKETVKVPRGLESTTVHRQKMNELSSKPGKVLRKDGDPEKVFRTASKMIERTYTGPYLAHNTMEPVNCFAYVTPEKADIYGPIQAPEFTMQALVARLGLPKEKIHIRLARMGGGFGQRAYGHHLVEAAVISQKMRAPIKLMYTREDDMSYGIYRPTYTATYKAALDENNNLIAFHVKGGGVPEHPVAQNRFIAGAEQSFLDEVAELAGKDPIDFRLELLERAKKHPVGKDNDYDVDRYAGVLKLVRDKSNWGKTAAGVHRGVAAYFCHNTYVAEVLDLKMEDKTPKVQKVYAAVDCGIVINPDAARNMGEGGIVDGIGNALFGEMTFVDGEPEKRNFDKYRLIRQKETPRSIDIHFVQNDQDPTGLGEPLFPPIFAAVANAMYKATGQRYYEQPFTKSSQQPLTRL